MSLETDSLQDEIRRLGESMFDGRARDGLDDWRVRDIAIGKTFGAQLQLIESEGR